MPLLRNGRAWRTDGERIVIEGRVHMLNVGDKGACKHDGRHAEQQQCG